MILCWWTVSKNKISTTCKNNPNFLEVVEILFSPIEYERKCPFCGGNLVIRYEEENSKNESKKS